MFGYVAGMMSWVILIVQQVCSALCSNAHEQNYEYQFDYFKASPKSMLALVHCHTQTHTHSIAQDNMPQHYTNLCLHLCTAMPLCGLQIYSETFPAALFRDS